MERGMFRDALRIGVVHFFLWEGKKHKRRKTGNYLHPGKWGLGPHLANFPAPPPLLMATEPGPMREMLVRAHVPTGLWGHRRSFSSLELSGANP